MAFKPILYGAVSAMAPALVLAQDAVIRREPRPEFGGEQLLQLAALVMALLIVVRGYRSMRREQKAKRDRDKG